MSPRRWRSAARTASAAALTLATITGGFTPVYAAAADTSAPGDGTVKVRVVREVNANGTWDQALEPGMKSVQVQLTDDAGNTISGQTAADGTFTFNPASSGLTGSKYRVEVLNPKPGVLYPGFANRAGLGSDPSVLVSAEEFVDVSGNKNVELTTSFWNPADYCQKNAPLVTACIRNDIEGGTNDSTRTLVSFPYNTRGTDPAANVTNLADKTQTGAVYGIGYSKQKKWIFSGAMAFRGSNYGPAGSGGIYLTDRATGTTTLFTTVPNAGTTAHSQSIAGGQDASFMPAVSKESLGDVEISEDGKELYVVNLNDKKLYVYDATQKTAAAPKASWPIPDPGCPDPNDWRPGAIGVQDGTVYVGGVCSGQSTQKKSDMRAVVRTIDPKTGAVGPVIMDQKLDYPRANTFQSAASGCQGPSWYPWTDTIPAKQDGKTCVAGWTTNPEPFLTDINFETNGDLVLGFRDRFTDRVGWAAENTNPDGTKTRGWQPASGGSLSKACQDATGKFVMAENGGCGFTLPANPNPASTQYGFYDTRTYWEHGNAMYGGNALSKVEDTIASSAIDPAGEIFTNGTAFAKRDGSVTTDGATQGKRLSTTFGKAGSMADIEVMCDEAPIQIGNRVWYDNNKNGIQDPTENPVGGVTVNLYDETGKKVASTTTTSRGEYYFDSIKDGLKPETKYTIKLDNPADYAAGGPLDGWTVTQANAGTNDHIDSNGIVPSGGQFPEYSLTTGSAGQDNHTYDFGFTKPNGDVKVLKVDAKTGQPIAGAEFQLWMESNNQAGLQMDGATPDTKVGAVVTTDGNGAAKMTQQALGSYYWQETKAPAGYDLPNPAVFGPLDLTNANFRDGVTVTVKDEPVTPPPVLGEVQVEKVDQDGKPLPGAEFQLWRETNNTAGLQMTGINADTMVGGVVTTDANGIAKISGQPMGTYYWQETKVPAGYDMPANPISGPLELKPALRARNHGNRHGLPVAKAEVGE